MSAWLCSEDHINLLVNASDDPREEDFKLLVDENVRSLTARYPGRDFLDEWITEASTFKFKAAKPAEIVKAAISVDGREIKISDKSIATQIVKACNCYDYQACQTDDYNDTKAAAYVEAVRRTHAKHAGDGKLYDAMLWGI